METPVRGKKSMDTFYSIETATTGKAGSKRNSDVEIVLHEDEPPDGGWGWVVTFSAFFINVVMIGTHNCFGILYLDLLDEFADSYSNTAWVGSIAFGSILIFAPLSGYLSNKYGCRIITFIGVIIAAGSLYLSSHATSIPMLYCTYGFGFGFGTSLSYMQGPVMIARYFAKRRALASGFGLAGSTLGALAIAPFYNALNKCLRWRISLQVIAGLTMTCTICAATYRPIRPAKRRTREERMKSSPARKFVLDLSLWKNKAFVVWAIAVGLCKIGYLVPWVHMVQFAVDSGGERTFGSQLLQYMGVAATFSRLIVGIIADSPKVNRLLLSQFSASMMGVVNIIQAYTMSSSGLLVYAIMLGVLDGGVEILLPVMTLDLVGAKHLSIAWGSILAVISVSSIGPPVAGTIKDRDENYFWAFYFAGIPMILSALVLFLIPLWARNQKQNPTRSIMSINPSHLEMMQDNGKPKLCPGFGRALRRMFGRRRRNKRANGSKGQLLKKPAEQNRDDEGPGTSNSANRGFILPGN